jgi:hypothetical protein
MPTIIVFNDDSKDARKRLRVDEEPAEVAAALAKDPIPKLTAGGDPVWVNVASVRTIEGRKAQAKGAGGAGGGAGGKQAGGKNAQREAKRAARKAERRAQQGAAGGQKAAAKAGDKPKA